PLAFAPPDDGRLEPVVLHVDAGGATDHVGRQLLAVPLLAPALQCRRVERLALPILPGLAETHVDPALELFRMIFGGHKITRGRGPREPAERTVERRQVKTDYPGIVARGRGPPPFSGGQHGVLMAFLNQCAAAIARER